MSGSCHLPRYGILVKDPDLKSFSDQTSQEWLQISQRLSRLKWNRTWMGPDASAPSSGPVWSDPGPKFPTTIPAPSLLPNILHALMDLLPATGPSGYLFDIVWFSSDKAVKCVTTSPVLYGALRRAVEWHNARLVIIVSDSSDVSLPEELNARLVAGPALNCEDLDSALHGQTVWRGGLETFVAQDQTFKRISHATGMELVAKDSASFNRWLFGGPTSWGKSGPLVSRNLTMVSQCSLSSVPTYLLTDTRFQLKLTHPTDVSLLNSMFNDTTGIVAKLSYSTNTGSSGSGSFTSHPQHKLTFEDWKKYVIHGNYDERSSCHLTSPSNIDKELRTLDLLILDDAASATPTNSDKLCIVLDPNLGGVVKSSQVLMDTASVRNAQSPSSAKTSIGLPKAGRRVRSNPKTRSLPQIQSFIQRVQSMVLQMLLEKDPESEHLRTERMQETLMEIQSGVLSKLGDAKVKLASKDDSEYTSDCDESVVDDKHVDSNGGSIEDEPERRLLTYVDHLAAQRRAKHRAATATMAPSAVGEFVILEAKEMLKLFTKDGKARFPENCETLEVASVKNVIVANNLEYSPGEEIETKLKKDYGKFHKGAALVKYHGLHFNMDEECEKTDAEQMKYQRIHVGVNETRSTCHAQNSGTNSSVVITKRASKKPLSAANVSQPTVAPQSVVPPPLDQQPRRSPRKKPTSNATASFPPSAAGSQKQLGRQLSCAASVKSGASSQNTAAGGASSTSKKKQQEDLFRKKLRNAVYDALSKRGIDEKNDLFRACFKKLFEICKMYAKDVPKSAKNLTTSQWLTRVAEQNAEIVINLEKSLKATTS